MAQLKGKSIDAFVKQRDPHYAAVLVYGPDAGSVRERSAAILHQATPDFQDPFAFADLTEADLKADPAKLMDEAAALSMTGADRAVRVRLDTEAVSGPVKTLVAEIEKNDFSPAALVVVEAGDLKKSSALRKAFEGGKRVVALPCYADTETSLRTLIKDSLAAEEIRISPDALDFYASRLGEDRSLSRQEIDKLVLYMGPKATRPSASQPVVEVEDLIAIGIDVSGQDFDALSQAVASGDLKALEKELERTLSAGGSAIGALRALTRYMDRLHQAAAHMARGASAGEAMKKLRPPVFFTQTGRFEKDLRRWPLRALAMAADALLTAEQESKRTGAPQDILLSRVAFRLAFIARRSRR